MAGLGNRQRLKNRWDGIRVEIAWLVVSFARITLPRQMTQPVSQYFFFTCSILIWFFPSAVFLLVQLEVTPPNFFFKSRSFVELKQSPGI